MFSHTNTYDKISNQAKFMKMNQWMGFEHGLLQGKSSDLPIDLEALLMFE